MWQGKVQLAVGDAFNHICVAGIAALRLSVLRMFSSLTGNKPLLLFLFLFLKKQKEKTEEENSDNRKLKCTRQQQT